MQQSVIKFYCFVVQTLLNMFWALLCPLSGAHQTAVAASCFRMDLLVTNQPRLRKLPPLHSYGNQRLQRQFDGLLMMGIIMPETCWAVSVRQGNKISRLIVASRWVFYLSDWRCTEPQTLSVLYCCIFTCEYSNLQFWLHVAYKLKTFGLSLIDFSFKHITLFYCVLFERLWNMFICSSLENVESFKYLGSIFNP